MVLEMSYYIGFRHGWVRLFGRMVCWQDSKLYPYLPGWALIGSWKVWVK